MSIYVTNGDTQIQFASNKGWGDVCRSVKADTPMGQLCDQGLFEPVGELIPDLRSAIDSVSEATVQKTLSLLLDYAVGLDTDDPIVVTDGMGPDNEGRVMLSSFRESDHPRDEDGKFSEKGGGKMASKNNFPIDEEASKLWKKNGFGYGRVQDGRSPVPERSSNDWYGDDEEEMDGASALLSAQAFGDILFGHKDGNGENYSELVEDAGGDPYLVIIDSDDIGDGPGGEFLVRNAKIGAVYTKQELQRAFIEWSEVDADDFDFDEADEWEVNGKDADDQDNIEAFMHWLSGQ